MELLNGPNCRFLFEGREIAWGVLGEGPALVLVHGTPFSSHVWHRVAPWLARRNRVYFYDLLGYGRSDMTPGRDVSIATQSRALAALFGHWQLERPSVLAHDIGGATVLRGLLLHGLRFNRLTLVDPVVLSPWGSPFVQHVREHQSAFAALPAYAHRALLESYIRGALQRQPSNDELEPYLEPWLSSEGQAAFFAQIAQLDSKHTEAIEARLDEIACPTTVVWGEADEWLPFEQGERLAKLIPGARLLRVPGAGHLVQEDAPEAVLAAML